MHEMGKSSAHSENFSGTPVMPSVLLLSPGLLTRHRPPKKHFTAATGSIGAACQGQAIVRETRLPDRTGMAFERRKLRA